MAKTFNKEHFFDKLYKTKIFARTIKKRKDFKQFLKDHIHVFTYDITEDNLGLSNNEKQHLNDNIDLVICFMDLNSPQAPLK